jgi:hypothetical protein
LRLRGYARPKPHSLASLPNNNPIDIVEATTNPVIRRHRAADEVFDTGGTYRPVEICMILALHQGFHLWKPFAATIDDVFQSRHAIKSVEINGIPIDGGSAKQIPRLVDLHLTAKLNRFGRLAPSFFLAPALFTHD